MLTQERADILTKFLVADAENAKDLLQKSPEDALEVINSNNHDFTLEELNEYCDAFKAAAAATANEGELGESELTEVSGGVVLTAGLVVGLLACFAGGAAIGIAAGAKW